MNKQNKNILKDDERKLKLSFWKMTYMWFPLWTMMRKAKKINKKNYKNPGYYSEEYCYNFAKKSASKILKVANIDVRVEGYDNWIDRGVVLVVNHQSNFDPIILFAINNFFLQQPLAFIAKKELWTDKKFGRFVKIVDCIPIDRESPRSALEAFKEAKQLVVEFRRSLAIFPEGTRSKEQNVHEFHDASLKIAQMANAPVIPVTIINSYQIFKKNRPKKIEVKVVFGKPIMPAKHISLKTQDLARNVKKIIVDNLEKFKDKELSLGYKTINKINPKNIENLKNKNAAALADKKPKSRKKIKDFLRVVE